MSIPFFLARRFLAGAGGKKRLLGTVSTLALLGVALGAASLVVAMGLMSGYRKDLAEKLAGTNAEVLVMGDDEGETARAALVKLPHVVAIARTAFAPALLLSASVPSGVDALVKGLDLPAGAAAGPGAGEARAPAGGLATTRLLGSVPDLARRLASHGGGPVPALLGAGIARRLGVGEGDAAILETATASLAKGVAPPRRTAVKVAAIVETGFSEVDDGWVVVSLAELERFAPPETRRGIWELKLTKASLSDETVAAARRLLGPSVTVLDWKTLNRDLFQALVIQQTLLFVVLTLIVAVAAGTVVSSLVVLLAEKTREVGVLSALGATPRDIQRTFRLSGLFLGGGGLVLGTVFGVVVCAVLTATHAVRFPPEIAKIYYLSWMPFRPEPLHVLGILAVGLVLVLLASALPARRASLLEPAEALRYE